MRWPILGRQLSMSFANRGSQATAGWVSGDCTVLGPRLSKHWLSAFGFRFRLSGAVCRYSISTAFCTVKVVSVRQSHTASQFHDVVSVDTDSSHRLTSFNVMDKTELRASAHSQQGCYSGLIMPALSWS